MTPAQILEAAITKAIEGGWNLDEEDQSIVLGWKVQVHCSGALELVVDTEEHTSKWQALIFIFNHDFAKAIWGDSAEFPTNTGLISLNFPRWQYHLQQMVIAEDPIAYLGEHLG